MHTTGLVDLGLTPSGAMDVPKDAATAGWFALSPVPGEVGPAVLAAHVDYERVPGVFARLREMKVGDTAEVTRSDGALGPVHGLPRGAVQQVRVPHRGGVRQHRRPRAPARHLRRRVRRDAGHYRDNVVVFARLT